MSVIQTAFGTTSRGQAVSLFELQSSNGIKIAATNMGASLVSCWVPNAQGEFLDVLLGFDDACFYEHNLMAYGGTLGRYAGRIADARFHIRGHSYDLTPNLDGNALHGGRHMWFERLWNVLSVQSEASGGSVTFQLLSRDGDQGFPGAVDARVTYALTEWGDVRICYEAHPSASTVINMSCHGYWNLNGHNADSMLDHRLRISARRYLELGARGIPSGRMLDVHNTPFDFSVASPLREHLSPEFDNIDHTFCLQKGLQDSSDAPDLVLQGDKSGITMELRTTAPSIQIFTASMLNDLNGKHGAHYGAYAGLAIEPELFPDAMHHEKDFPTSTCPYFDERKPFRSTTTLSFSTTEV